MPASPRYLVRRPVAGDPTVEVGALFDLPQHGQVCLHSEDSDLIRLLVERRVLSPGRPPFLDAAPRGIHGAYQPLPQINVFLAPPIDQVAAAIADATREAGYTIEPVIPAAEHRAGGGAPAEVQAPADG